MSQQELKAITGEEKFINVNPQISYFKSVHKRHTNFSKEYRAIDRENLDNSLAFNTQYNYVIRQEGDLLNKCFFEVVISGTSADENGYTVDHFGHSLFKEMRFKIGDITIDTHTSKWLQVSSELMDTHYKYPHMYQGASDTTKGGLNEIKTGNTSVFFNRSELHISRRMNGDYPLLFGGQTPSRNYAFGEKYYKKFFIPLKFFFNKDLSNSLPLCALHIPQIKIEVDIETQANLIGAASTITLEELTLYGEFIHLDTDEKRRFMNSTLTYLVETVQRQEVVLSNSVTQNTNYSSGYANALDKPVIPRFEIPMNDFKHPVKYLTWVVHNTSSGGPCYFMSMISSSDYGNDGVHGTFTIELNGDSKERELPLALFTRQTLRQHCNYIPDLDRIGLYSFALNPFNSQPSGTCNFSIFSNNNKSLFLKLANEAVDGNNSVLAEKTLHLFAVSYNIFRVMSGLGGLVFI